MPRVTTDAQANASRNLSTFWHRFLAKKAFDPSSVGFFFDDFLPPPYLAATGTCGNWYGYLDASNLIKAPASCTLANGEMGLVGLYTDADNDNPTLTLASGNVGAPFKISDTSGEDFMLAFECRFQLTSVADDVSAIFLGLMEEGGAVDSSKVDNTGVTIDNDFIGFDSVHTNGGTAGTNAVLGFKYKKDGQTQQTVISTLQTMVSSIWYKVGFLYNPRAATENRIAVFLNGEEQSTYVTGANIAAATFPDGEEMVPTFINKIGGATDGTLILDWVACGQMFLE